MKHKERLSAIRHRYRSHTEEYISTMGVFSDVIILLLATLA
jgi:hypothetical protein